MGDGKLMELLNLIYRNPSLGREIDDELERKQKKRKIEIEMKKEDMLMELDSFRRQNETEM